MSEGREERCTGGKRVMMPHLKHCRMSSCSRGLCGCPRILRRALERGSEGGREGERREGEGKGERLRDGEGEGEELNG